jgi:ribosome-associated protein
MAERLNVGDRPINLTQLLKLAGWVLTGGEAKELITEGRISVNGQVEFRKRRKMIPGDAVDMRDGPSLILESPDPPE